VPDDEIGLFEAIFTQRAIRRFKPDPVPQELLERVLTAATKAPSGGNMQPWAFVVIRDQEKLQAAAEIARQRFERLYEHALARQQPGDPPPMPNLKRMIDEIDLVPSWIVVCADGPPGVPAEQLQGSLYPAVQNLLLAARGVGLGAVLTGLLAGEGPGGVRELLDLPEHVQPIAFIPIGYPADGVHYGPTTRRPLSEVVHWDRWDTEKVNTAAVSHRA
jgi:nitroreductase